MTEPDMTLRFSFEGVVLTLGEIETELRERGFTVVTAEERASLATLVLHHKALQRFARVVGEETLVSRGVENAYMELRAMGVLEPPPEAAADLGAPHRIHPVVEVSDLAVTIGRLEGAVWGVLQAYQLPPLARLGLENSLDAWKKASRVVWCAIHVALAHQDEFRAQLAKSKTEGKGT